MRIALPLASTSWLVQANVDSMQGLQEVRHMDQAQGLQLLYAGMVVLLQVEEVKAKEDAQQEVLQRAE
jgi:hypothetical protein